MCFRIPPSSHLVTEIFWVSNTCNSHQVKNRLSIRMKNLIGKTITSLGTGPRHQQWYSRLVKPLTNKCALWTKHVEVRPRVNAMALNRRSLTKPKHDFESEVSLTFEYHLLTCFVVTLKYNNKTGKRIQVKVWSTERPGTDFNCWL